MLTAWSVKLWGSYLDASALGDGRVDWTTARRRALRFASRQQARDVARALEGSTGHLVRLVRLRRRA